MLDDARYKINRAKKVAFCSSEYGLTGYDPQMGDFTVPIPLSDYDELEVGAENVGYAVALDYAMANPATQPQMPKEKERPQ